MMSMRVWTVGDSEPEDHPDVVAGDDDEHMPGPWHYRWEPPSEYERGGWWCVEFGGNLWDWEEILEENCVLTEVMDDDNAGRFDD